LKTSTKTFGSSSRESHDSSVYYARKMSKQKTLAVTAVKRSECRNRIINKSSERMKELPSNSVALMVTSPPYNCGKDYDDNLTLPEYLRLLKRVLKETYRVLEPGGRACVNLANMGRKPYIPLASYVNKMMSEIGFLMRGEIIWQKAAGASGSCAWGSFNSASNPTLRDLHEYILVFSKGDFRRAYKGKSTISTEAFMRDTLSIWNMRPESASKIGHPAPFPVELPFRLIDLYTYEGDLVLDPFMGSGTTCVAAKMLHRDYIGYDTKRRYCDIARNRLSSLAYSAATE